MKATLIKNGTLITMDDQNTIINNGSVLIAGNRIKRILQSEELSLLQAGRDYDTIIDAAGKIVLPGFINAHGHAGMSLFRSIGDDLPLMDWLEKKIWPLENKLQPDDVYWGTLLSIVEMVKGGTTTFTDMYFFMDQVAQAVEESGIRGVLSRGMVGTGEGAIKSLQESEEFCRAWHGQASGRITVTLGPHAPYTCPPDFLEKVLELRGRLNIPLQIHLAETEWEIAYCREHFNMSPIQLVDSIGLLHVPTLAAHCVHVSAEDIAILAERKVRVAHNPGSNLKLASGIAPVPQMLEAGIVVALGTDGPSSNNNLDMLEEARLAALIHKGVTKNPQAIPAITALKMATAHGAMAVFNEETGSLAKGKLADLTIMKYAASPHMRPGHNAVSDVIYAGSSGDVETVMVDGQIILEEGRCRLLDEERILFEASERSKKLLNNP